MANVALVYGSFFMGDSERNIKDIQTGFPKIDGLVVADPVEGNKFDFNSLKDLKFLVVCTSSQYGFPPPNIKEFVHQLLMAATSNPGCLSHLQHAVYGNGDETYFKTYMNMPRYIDKLLEKCGSRRFYARGETGEPHAPAGTGKLTVHDWVPGMWAAAAQGLKDGAGAPPVAWDALWAKEPSEHHSKVTEFDLKKLEKKLGALKSAPSIFSKL
jgi:sulfite reductase alpha subunit-like flavoprotein